MDALAPKLGLLFALISGGLLIGSYLTYRNTQRWLTHTAETTGQIMSFVRRSSVDSFNRDHKRESIVYYPTVQYQAPSGELITFESSVGSSPPSYAEGQQVAVRYNVDNPRDAQINDFMSLWLLPIILGFIGAMFLVASCGLIFFQSTTYTFD